jgi:putative toxin-antitoxin system antitoxin component (TIGR02293 family)
VSDDTEVEMSVAEVAQLLGGSKVLGRGISSQLKMADAVDRGLPTGSLDRVKGELGMSDTEVAHALGISLKTIHRLRRDPDRHLSSQASDRLYRLARLYQLASEVLEDAGSAREWLRSPKIGLDNRIPMDLMTSEAGSREVEALLMRIEYGVIS